MTVNVPLLPRQGSGSSLDPPSQPVSPSLTVHVSTYAPSSTYSSSTPTQPTDPQSSNPTSSSTTSSSFTSSASASSPDDLSSTSTISSLVIVTSSMATSSSFSPPSSGVPTPSPSNPPPTASTNTPASSAPITSVTGTGVPLSLPVTINPSSTIAVSPPPPATTSEPPPLSNTGGTTTPTPSPTLSTGTDLPASSSISASEDPVGGNRSIATTIITSTSIIAGSGNPSITTPSTIIITSTSTLNGGGGPTTQPASSSSTQPGFLSSGVIIPATSSSTIPFSLTQPVTFTTTNLAGSTFTTVPEFFTTVFITTRSNGEPTTISQIVVNPTGILSPGDNRSQNTFFRNKGAVVGVFLAVGLTAIGIVILGIFAIWKRRKTRRQRNVGGAKGASRARSPLEPDEAGQDPSIYAVAARHPPVDMRSGAPGPGEEESGSFGHGPSVFGSSILLNQPAQVTNVAVPPEQQPHSYYPYFPSPSGHRSPSPGEAHPSSTRGLLDGSNAPPAYFLASHPYSRKTPSPVFAGPLVSVPGSPTNHMGSVRGAPPSAYGGAIFGDSKQPSSEGHGSSMENKRGPGLESMDVPSRDAILPPMVAYAYEPEPVTWNHRIVGGSPVGDTRDHTSSPSPRNLQASALQPQQDPQSNRGSMTNLSASVYSQDWEVEPDVGRPTLRVVNDPRISPELGVRLRGGLASEHSFGPRDDEDWSTRVGAQMIANDSTLQVANPAETRHPAE